ncbi:ABC transporter substrate-binding protein [Alcaligenaceae bacterium]|nr:ABC transporter substrate-binding protein [Alcaligenaceae bacterium]
MKKQILALTAALGMAAALAPVVQAGTLEDIKARGKFICGTMGTAEPFSFQDPKTRAIVGYEVDMCQAVADSLKVPLELKLIAVEARIPELVAGRVDLIAANLGWTPERAQQIDYSFQHFASLQKVLARESDKDLKSPADLAGKRVSAVRGSSSEAGARKHIPNVETVTFKDPSGAFLAVQQGKVSGFVISELNAVKFKAQAANSPVPVKLLEPALFLEPWGMGMRKGDTEFRNHVNKVLTDMDASGQADRIYDKWFGADTLYKMKREFKIAEITG